MKKIVITLKIVLNLIIINHLKGTIMDAKKESVIRIVVQFIVTLLGTLLGINL